MIASTSSLIGTASKVWNQVSPVSKCAAPPNMWTEIIITLGVGNLRHHQILVMIVLKIILVYRPVKGVKESTAVG